jgi:predicted GNAT superfamily acetyltransferase
VAVQLRALAPADLAGVLALNQAHVPHVGALDADRLDTIVQQCSLALVAVDDEGADAGPAGVVLVLAPGADYDSPNYRWFCEHHDDFRYVDRIAVAGHAHRSGLGRRLYGAVFDHARAGGAPWVTAEVNLEPPNPGSLAFHHRLGFREVGQQDTYGGSVRVSLLAAPVDAPAPRS